MSNKIRVGITQGDFNGVGPEIILKSLAEEEMVSIITPVVFADWRIIEQARVAFGLEMPAMKRIQHASEAEEGCVNIVDVHMRDVTVTPGRPSQASGEGSVAALDAAVAALKQGEVDVLVTAPISKEAVQSNKFSFHGHTEYLNAKAGDEFTAQMILFDDYLRVALLTTHVAVADIPANVTRDRIHSCVRSFDATLRRDFGIERPKIAVLSLNPHCGDGGLLGDEEAREISPAIEDCIADGLLAFGPYAADGFFGAGSYTNFDGVLAMYHEQGLAPFKALARESGVNFTAGLPFVRTSPDHGTAYDIAWKGEASPVSMRQAIYEAVDIFRRRVRYDEAASDPLRHQQADKAPKSDRPRRAPGQQHDADTDNETNAD